MHTAEPIHAPSLSRISLTLTDGALLTNPTEYRNMVGALQYLTVMRPDIAYAVHLVSQYMHTPCTTHLYAVKFIFRYLQGTLSYGLQLRPAASPSIIVAYSDADG